MPPTRVLLLLAVLCARTSCLCLRAHDADAELLCDTDLLPGARGAEPPGGSVLGVPGFLFGPGAPPASGEARERRAYAAPDYRILSRTQLRSKMYRNSAKSDRRSQLTLSLDVPTNIMNILFDIAKAQSLRAKAAHNARLMAQIGRRK
ncbi:urocortin 3, like [Denticeps clupeoides]|nr:urocortin-3 [Denticeps clupeoides]